MNGAMPKKKVSCGDRRNTGSGGGKNEVDDQFRWTKDTKSWSSLELSMCVRGNTG